MKKQTAIKLVEKELSDLGLLKSDIEYQAIYNNAVEAAEILTKSEVIKLLEEQADSNWNWAR